MLESLIERVQRTQIHQMITVTGDSDHVASIKLHKSLGFRMVGTMENTGFKFGSCVYTIITQKLISSGYENPPHI